MPLVIDVSVMASWHFPDEKSVYGDRVQNLLRNDSARLPTIWWFELRNVLLIGERRKRVDEANNIAFLQALSMFRLTVDALPDELAVLTLARRHRLSFYDACYLELAHRERLPLATLDQALARAAADEGIALIGA